MAFSLMASLALAPMLFALSGNGYQVPLQDGTNNSQPRVAVIGAGIAGASTAFELRHYTGDPFVSSFDTTVYEQKPRIGGRVQAVSPSSQEIRGLFEVGAARFSTEDWCLATSAEDVGLKVMASDPTAHRGRPNSKEERTQLNCDFKSISWADLARMTWKYARSPWIFHKAVVATSEGWESFAQYGTFARLQDALEEADIDGGILDSATDYLGSLDISEDFQREIVQPCLRARAHRNLAEVSGLAALMSASGSLVSIKGGNGQLIQRMLRLSDANIRLNSKVTSIDSGIHRRYRLSVSHRKEDGNESIEDPEFDTVIIASPLSGNSLDLSALHTKDLASVTDASQFSEAHVTHLLTPAELPMNTTDPPLDIAVPDDQTILLRADILTSSATESPNILSLRKAIQSVRRYCSPGDPCDEFDREDLYRIQSRRRMEDRDLVKILGGASEGPGSRLDDYNVSWLHRQVWPKAYPQKQEQRVPVDDIRLGPQLFYLSGAEEVVSSMEMSCRMGRMTAKTICYRKF